jgi:hypothetical protein
MTVAMTLNGSTVARCRRTSETVVIPASPYWSSGLGNDGTNGEFAGGAASTDGNVKAAKINNAAQQMRRPRSSREGKRNANTPENYAVPEAWKVFLRVAAGFAASAACWR